MDLWYVKIKPSLNLYFLWTDVNSIEHFLFDDSGLKAKKRKSCVACSENLLSLILNPNSREIKTCFIYKVVEKKEHQNCNYA